MSLRNHTPWLLTNYEKSRTLAHLFPCTISNTDFFAAVHNRWFWLEDYTNRTIACFGGVRNLVQWLLCVNETSHLMAALKP